jgi:hypothetical protein
MDRRQSSGKEAEADTIARASATSSSNPSFASKVLSTGSPRREGSDTCGRHGANSGQATEHSWQLGWHLPGELAREGKADTGDRAVSLGCGCARDRLGKSCAMSQTGEGYHIGKS